MSQIKVSKLTFAYEGSFENIFSDVSFTIDTDWKLGFCGRNGRGKTTFLKLLTGRYAYSGSISASVRFDYFPITVQNMQQITWEIIEAIAPDAQEWQIYKELSLLSVDAEILFRPFETLSGGEQTKVLLAGLFLCENNFLLIDEPTNHLDTESRGIVARYLKQKKGFILVSHDRFFLDECVDHILSINKSNIEVIAGNFSTWIMQKERRDSFEASQNERLKLEIGRLQKSAEQTANWSDSLEKTKYGTRNSGLRPDRGYIGHKAAKMMKRSKVIEKRQMEAIAEKSALLQNIERVDELKIQPLTYHAERLLSVRNLCISYGDIKAVNNISFDLKRRERLSLQGKNGSGKSSILKLLSNCNIPHTGTVEIGGGLSVSYLPQNFDGLSGSLNDFARANGIDETQFFTLLNKLDFSKAQFDKDLSEFSAGQKKKTLLAKSLLTPAHLYIWDEPLNYIDIMSRMQIEELILTHCPTMIFVEHDSAFCKTIATESILL